MTSVASVAGPEPLMRSALPLSGRREGKVRDIYETTLPNRGAALVIIATDRISAFDVVMPNGIGGKGIVLTQISRFWFDMIARTRGNEIQHHLISTDPKDIPELDYAQRAELTGRVMIGHKTNVVPIECVVRGYLAGGGWADYRKSQSVCGVKLPSGLGQCAKLPEPIFTPATKAEEGHDENISFDRACDIAGRDLISRIRRLSMDIYQMGHDHAAQRGIILADTKFEFGLTDDGQLLLIDEVLTPDSSRFWPADQYEPGHDQPSYDKQYVRNHLQELVDQDQWDKTPPAPALPKTIVHNTRLKYLEAYRSLTGQELTL